MDQKRILVVDDDIHVLEMLRISIKAFFPSYQVTLAPDGFAALGQLRRQKETSLFDLILTDYEMPKMTGLDLAQTVQQTWPNTRIVLMSGHADSDELRRKAGALSLDAFIKKPFSMHQLQEALEPNAF